MTQRTPDRTKQAARMAASNQRRAESERARAVAALHDVVDAIAALDLERAALLARRDQAVAGLAGHYSMAEISRMAGTSRQALMKRMP